MTEAEWKAITDPLKLLDLVWGPASRRKRALINCGWLRNHWHLLADDETRETVAEAERLADGIGPKPTAPMPKAVRFPRGSFGWSIDPKHSGLECRSVASGMQTAVGWYEPDRDRSTAVVLMRRVLCSVVRCLFKNPHDPVTLEQAWLTPKVVSQAEDIYADRAFDRLPILADALQDAGCENADMLAHCRGEGPHARGCWVVDLVLGKV